VLRSSYGTESVQLYAVRTDTNNKRQDGSATTKTGNPRPIDHFGDLHRDGRIIRTMLTGSEWILILSTASQHKRMTYTNCCIYRVLPPDDEQ